MEELKTRTLTPAEAVFGVFAWLTTRDKDITLGRSHDASEAAHLAEDFCKANGLGDCSDDWPDGLVHPTD